MSMNAPALFFAIGCCLVSFTVSGMAANKKGREWLAGLNHPDNAFMTKAMPILGLFFYGSFGYVLYHLSANGYVAPTILVAAVVQINGIAALLLYKCRRLKLFLVASLSIPLLLLAIIFFLARAGMLLAIIPALYLLWLLYDFSYFYRLWKLNKQA